MSYSTNYRLHKNQAIVYNNYQGVWEAKMKDYRHVQGGLVGGATAEQHFYLD
jgi:hypothetical protein